LYCELNDVVIYTPLQIIVKHVVIILFFFHSYSKKIGNNRTKNISRTGKNHLVLPCITDEEE